MQATSYNRLQGHDSSKTHGPLHSSVRPISREQDFSQDDLEIEQIQDGPLHQDSNASRSQIDSLSPRLPILGDLPTPIHKENPQARGQTQDDHHSVTDRNSLESHDGIHSFEGRVQTFQEFLPSKHHGHALDDSRAQRENTEPHSIPETVSPPERESSFETELYQRLQTLFQRLQNNTAPQRHEDSDVGLAPRLSAPDSNQFTGAKDAKVPLGEDRPDNQPVGKNGLSTPPLQEPKALQVPGWVTDVQTKLSRRMKEIDSKSGTEPVVNVTIGRVEVRAIQNETRRQSKPQKKSTGVMSLNDYLKQREYRGQA